MIAYIQCEILRILGEGLVVQEGKNSGGGEGLVVQEGNPMQGIPSPLCMKTCSID